MTKDLATIESGPVSIESYADNLNAKLQVANILLKSGMAPQHYKSPEAVLGAVLYGRELGFSPIRALHAINVIEGKPVLSAEGLKALAIQHGGKIQTVEWTEKVCTLKCARGDWVEECTFTIQDAALQGLTNKDNWKRMPKAMLYARCVSTLVRNMFADVLGGLYSAEEMRDSTPEPRNVTPKVEVIDANVEVIEDDIPESFNPKERDLAVKQVKDLIDGDDLNGVGDWRINTAGSTNGMTVREAVKLHHDKVKANLSKYKAADKLALGCWLEHIDGPDLPEKVADDDSQIDLYCAEIEKAAKERGI